MLTNERIVLVVVGSITCVDWLALLWDIWMTIYGCETIWWLTMNYMPAKSSERELRTVIGDSQTFQQKSSLESSELCIAALQAQEFVATPHQPAKSHDFLFLGETLKMFSSSLPCLL